MNIQGFNQIGGGDGVIRDMVKQIENKISVKSNEILGSVNSVVEHGKVQLKGGDSYGTKEKLKNIDRHFKQLSGNEYQSARGDTIMPKVKIVYGTFGK